MQYLSENAGTGEGEKSPEDVMKREAILLGSMPQIFRDLEHQIIESLPRCMRLLPQHNNSGGFFVAVFEKDVAPFTFQNEAHELEMINHINVRTKLRQQAFQRVCQMQQDILQSKNNNRQEEEKDELQLSGNEQSSEVEEDDVKKEVEDGLNIDSVETGEEEETNNNDKADLNSCSMIKTRPPLDVGRHIFVFKIHSCFVRNQCNVANLLSSLGDSTYFLQLVHAEVIT